MPDHRGVPSASFVAAAHANSRAGAVQAAPPAAAPAAAAAEPAVQPTAAAAAPLEPLPQVDPHSIQLYYRTGWSQAWLHGSLAGGTWQDFALDPVPSAPGVWLVAKISTRKGSNGASPANGGSGNGNGGSSSSASCPLEFVATDRQHWDKPLAGGNYVIPGPGRYRMSGGTITPVTGQAVLVVSDLDGTMVGDDVASGAFKAFWEETGVPRGGVLAYNTGRSLDSFVNLLQQKSHCLAHPDVLISGVGTQVHTFDGRAWQLDLKYAALLDEGWALETVREAGYQALAMVGKEQMHFRPADEQNAHKITCGVNVAVLPRVLESVHASLKAGKVDANVITSGTGDWRYMDIVAVKAGKLEALNYVRIKYGFPVGSAVACGDSGNDILMLSGANPAIVVANAQPDLATWVAQEEAAGRANGPDGRRRLLVTQHHEAYGILEGLDHFGFK